MMNNTCVICGKAGKEQTNSVNVGEGFSLCFDHEIDDKIRRTKAKLFTKLNNMYYYGKYAHRLDCANFHTSEYCSELAKLRHEDDPNVDHFIYSQGGRLGSPSNNPHVVKRLFSCQ